MGVGAYQESPRGSIAHCKAGPLAAGDDVLCGLQEEKEQGGAPLVLVPREPLEGWRGRGTGAQPSGPGPPGACREGRKGSYIA